MYGSRALGTSRYGGVFGTLASTTQVTKTPTTTLATIAADLVTAVEALIPSTLAKAKYTHTRTDWDDFRTYAAENDGAVFRQFEISFASWTDTAVTNTDTQRREAELELVIAYPHHWRLYLQQSAGSIRNRAAMLQVIEEDVSQIFSAVGIHGVGNYPAGALPKFPHDITIEDDEGVTFAVLSWEVEWIAESSVDSFSLPNPSSAVVAAGDIQDYITTAIEDLTPASISSYRFQLTRTELDDFRLHAETNASSCLRQFSIDRENWNPISYGTAARQRKEAVIDVVVAYPHSWFLYRRKESGSITNRSAMLATIEEDMNQVIAAIGILGSQNHPPGVVPKHPQSITIEPGNGVTFGVASFTVEFFAEVT